MTDMRTIAQAVQNTPFLEDLLEEFVTRGLGSLPGRETTIELVRLLLKHHPGWQTEPPSDYDFARLLRTSPRKIRNIRDELNYRDPTRDKAWCKKQLRNLLESLERIQDGDYVTIQIDDGLVRDYARSLVQKNLSVAESGMNTAVVKISAKSFVALIIEVMPEKEQKRLLGSISEKTQEKHQDKAKPKTPIRLFLDSFAKSAGKEAGKQTVNLGFTLLTGGLNQVDSAISMVKKMFKTGKGSSE